MVVNIVQGQKSFDRIVRYAFIVFFITASINIIPQAWAVEPGNSTAGYDTADQPLKLRAVLFFSPTCPHCRKIITEYLPGIIKESGQSLKITLINTTNLSGQALFEAAMERFQVSKKQQGVPILIMGEVALISDTEIIQNFAKVVESHRLAGGVGLPDIPGLKEELAKISPGWQAPSSSNGNPHEPKGTDTSFMTIETDNAAAMTESFSLKSKLLQDPVGNTLAILVLLWMILSVSRFAKALLTKRITVAAHLPYWAVPLFSLTGLGISAYLTYVKMTYIPTLCGPIGNCNAVQLSPYSLLFGVIPVALMGIGGYVSILFAWLLTRCGRKRLSDAAFLLLVIMIFAGTIFSIYLTFLEPFVIGAVCMWCLASAALIGGLMWMTTGPILTKQKNN